MCDIFVLPSRGPGETWGLAVNEAMACGKPVISTQLGTGTCFVNQDGVTGFVVKPYDSNVLADKINLLINDSKLRTQMGANGRQRVVEYFNPERFASQLKDTIFDVWKYEN